jgi:3-oxoacyl-[acyl-carrier protein] reductase
MVYDVENRLGPIDILVNNAGVGAMLGLDLTEEDFDRTIAVNLKSAFLCIQAVLPGMRARRWGRIINISSIAARGAGAVSVAYNASKAGLEGLTRGYASRLAAEGVTVNSIAPALIDTEMAKPLAEAGFVSRVPVGRFGTSEEIAQIAMMLVGNAFMTGQTIGANGGMMFS